ncbi:MAG: GNAT family N-acetyltransferase [Firmicutes bacterium]|nr:GNAT family N-acetyltransferase [Bacillota bacterium]
MKETENDCVIRSLTNGDMPAVLIALRDSFSGYFIPMDLDMSKLLLMFHLYDIKTRYSFVLEEEGRMSAVMLIGRRGDTARTGPMGVISSRQKSGLGEKLIKYSIPLLRDFGIKRMILEVITENHPAIRLYEKCGFKKTRNLYSYQIEDEKLFSSEKAAEAVICKEGKNIPDDVELWLENYPWQRDWNTFKKLKNECEYLCSGDESDMLHLALWHKSIQFIIRTSSGKPVQTDRVNNKENSSLISRVAGLIAEARKIEPMLSFNNITEDELFYEINKHLGYKNYINQYEMELVL